MTLLPQAALLGWIPISLFFFFRYPIRIAILLTFVAGWAVLPAANYTPSTDPFPYWILGTDIATDYFLTKATAIGLAGLLGFLIFDRGALRRFTITLWDIPMLIWCVVPMLSAIANPVPFSSGIRSEAYQLLAWGVPYLLGRLYFTDTNSLRLAAKAFVLAGLCYIPICLVEIRTGPQLYTHLYGYLPYQWIGAKRYIGYRPIGLLEGGNQLGIWMATSTLIAVWLWAKQILSRILGIPIGWIALGLFVTTLLCQSGGSILLLLGLMPFVFVSHKTFPRILAVILIVGIVLFAGLRLANVIHLRSLVHQNAVAHFMAAFLKKIGRGSFGWRLWQDELHVNIALHKPLLGYGEWDWWRSGNLRPWGLWLLVFGMYGAFGLLALELLQLIPVIRVVWFSMTRSDIEALNLRHALAAVILMSAVDNLLNSSMILPLLIVIGGMSAWRSAGTEVHVELESPGLIIADNKKEHPQF
jgi:hypothetical protein